MLPVGTSCSPPSGRTDGKDGSHWVLEGRKKRLIVRPRVRAERVRPTSHCSPCLHPLRTSPPGYLWVLSRVWLCSLVPSSIALEDGTGVASTATDFFHRIVFSLSVRKSVPSSQEVRFLRQCGSSQPGSPWFCGCLQSPVHSPEQGVGSWLPHLHRVALSLLCAAGQHRPGLWTPPLYKWPACCVLLLSRACCTFSLSRVSAVFLLLWVSLELASIHWGFFLGQNIKKFIVFEVFLQSKCDGALRRSWKSPLNSMWTLCSRRVMWLSCSEPFGTVLVLRCLVDTCHWEEHG